MAKQKPKKKQTRKNKKIKKKDTLKDWQKKEAQKIKQEFKKYSPELKPNSKKSAERCAVTAMTLAHHGTPEALEALKKFKKDSRAPGWIDCAIEECEMMLWDDTTGVKIDKAEEKIRKAAEKAFEKKLTWDKKTITQALKIILTKQKVKFTYGQPIKLYYKNKVVGKDKAEFIIDDVLLIGIKLSLSDWIIRFKNGLEDQDLRKGDLENIEQSNFDEFYDNLFYNQLEMSKKPQGILLDFSGNKLYGKYFSTPLENGCTRHHCPGLCEYCLEELKCETAQEYKVEDDKKRYRILKKLIKNIKETEQKIEKAVRPSIDLEYQIEIAKKLKNKAQQKFKKEKNKQKKETSEQEVKKWNCQIFAMQSVLQFEQPKEEELEQLQTDRKMYQAIKDEIETKEYKKNVEGLEKYYSDDQKKLEPKDKDEMEIYHDPLCECDEEEPLTAEECAYKDKYDRNNTEIPIEDIPF